MTKKCPKPEDLNEIDRIMIHNEMFSEGIVPIENPDHDMRRGLSTLDPEEARRAKRKFRKRWRQLAKKMKTTMQGSGNATASKYVENTLGLGSKEPSRLQKHRRKQLVMTEIWDESIAPKLEAFENDLKKKKA